MKYEFFRDELGTVWFRDCVQIEADSYEEAKEKMINAVKNDEDLETVYSEPIWETWNPKSPDEEGGCATIEIEDPETQNIIWKNGK